MCSRTFPIPPPKCTEQQKSLTYQPLADAMLKIHDEDEENADYGRVRMYQALKYRKEVGKLDGIKIPCEAIVRSVMKQINLIHRDEPHKSTPKKILLHILRKQNVSFSASPFSRNL